MDEPDTSKYRQGSRLGVNSITAGLAAEMHSSESMSPVERETVIKEADRLLKRGRVRESLLSYDRVGVTPKYSKLMESGNRCLDQGETREAIAAFVRAGVVAATEKTGTNRRGR
jgi:hypothetical protein